MHDGKIPITRRKGVLGAITLAVLAAILFLGLAPYNPFGREGVHFQTGESGFRFHLFYPNDVRWLENENGLEFGSYGSLFSSGDFQAAPSRGAGGCSFEIWLQPATVAGTRYLFSFSTAQNPFQFRVSQVNDLLFVSRVIPDQAGVMKTVLLVVDRVFQLDKKLLLTVTSGEEGTAVYLNGSLAKTSSALRITTNQFAGQLVVGNTAARNKTWEGWLRGLAFYAREFKPDEVPQRYRVWASNGSFGDSDNAGLIALYTFAERAGNVVHNLAGGAPDLLIPDHFKILRQPLLVPLWQEFVSAEPYFYFRDAFLNVVAFVPFGLFVCAYFSSMNWVKRPALAAVILGGLVGLTIEILQSYLPLRESGTTDLITNTSGTALGAWLFNWVPLRQAFEKFGLV